MSLSPSSSSIATRASIRQYFPMGWLMSRGHNNPLTLHAVDDDIFRCVWSWIAETLVVDGCLSRATKEAVCRQVSAHNACPVCVNAHSMMNSAARYKQKEDPRSDIQEYTECLLQATRSGDESVLAKCAPSLSSLTTEERAEIAMLVLLFQHMNRVVSALMGEQMTSAMFGIPSFLAQYLESPSMLFLMTKMMAPLVVGALTTSYPPGISDPLFEDEPTPNPWPGVTGLGLKAAQALGRVNALAERLHESHFTGVVDSELIETLQHPAKSPAAYWPPAKCWEWIQKTTPAMVSGPQNANAVIIATVLWGVQYAPSHVFGSDAYEALQQSIGTTTARQLVIWWSLRTTLQQAKGI